MDGSATSPHPIKPINAKPTNASTVMAKNTIDFFPIARRAMENLQPFNPNTPEPVASHALLDPSTMKEIVPMTVNRPEPQKLKRLMNPTTYQELKRGSVLLGYESPGERISIRQAAVREAIEDSLMEEHLTYEDLKPHRIKTCYRITRYMIAILNAGNPQETLSELMCRRKEQVDPTLNFWYLQREPSKTYREHAKVLLLDFMRDIQQFIVELKTAPCQYVSLLPPLPLPVEKWPVFSEYQPHKHEPELILFVKLVSMIAKIARIDESTGRNPNEARYGMTGITDPWYCRIAWVDPLEMVDYEQNLLHTTGRRLIKYSTVQVLKYLTGIEGFNQAEAQNIIQLSRLSIGSMITNNETMNRNLLILRLENMWRRAKREDNFKAETEALKMMGVVQGLSSNIKDDLITQFMSAAKKYTQGGGKDEEILDAEVTVSPALEALPYYPTGVQVPPPAQIATKPKE